jgi:hypothetical protein
MKTAVLVTVLAGATGLVLAIGPETGANRDDWVRTAGWWTFDASILVLVWLGIAWLVRWAWHRGAPRATAGLRGWWENGR